MMVMLYEVRVNADGDPVLFDIDKKTRQRMREQHPIWLGRFKARDHEHAKRVFEALVGGPATYVAT